MMIGRKKQNVRTTLTQAFNDKSLAHVAIDLQRYYCDPAYDDPDIVRNDVAERRSLEIVAQRAASFAAAARWHDIPNIWVSHDPVAGTTAERQKMAFRNENRRKLELKMARRSFHPVLDVRADDIVVCKPSTSAFERTAFDQELKERGINTLMLSGVFLDVCVKDTALDAKRRGYNVILLKELVSSGSSKYAKSDKALLKRLSHEGMPHISPHYAMSIVKAL